MIEPLREQRPRRCSILERKRTKRYSRRTWTFVCSARIRNRRRVRFEVALPWTWTHVRRRYALRRCFPYRLDPVCLSLSPSPPPSHRLACPFQIFSWRARLTPPGPQFVCLINTLAAMQARPIKGKERDGCNKGEGEGERAPTRVEPFGNTRHKLFLFLHVTGQRRSVNLNSRGMSRASRALPRERNCI